MDTKTNKIRTGYLSFPKTARYNLLGNQVDPSRIWYVAHGYGQLARDFISNFESVSGNQLIVAPEGTSLFYVDSRYQKVGASWLTREEREIGIQEQISYLDKLHEMLCFDSSLASVPVGLLGFSQGVATIARWAKFGRIKPDQFVFWAGRIPQEWDAPDLEFLSGIEIQFVRGTRDSFIKTEWVESERSKLEEASIAWREVLFQGGHRMDRGVIQEIMIAKP